MKSTDVVAALGALAQESRLAVFRLLVEAGPEGLAASVVAARLGIPSATLSFHLKALSHAGLVADRRDGRFIYYSAHYERMNELLGFLTRNCCGGRSCAPASGPARGPARAAAPSPASAVRLERRRRAS